MLHWSSDQSVVDLEQVLALRQEWMEWAVQDSDLLNLGDINETEFVCGQSGSHQALHVVRPVAVSNVNSPHVLINLSNDGIFVLYVCSGTNSCRHTFVEV